MVNRIHQAAASTVVLFLAVLALAACDRRGAPLSPRSAALLAPRVPAPGAIRLAGLVTGLTNGATLVVNVNGVRGALITTDGAYTLLEPQPQGTAFVVSLPYQPSGHICKMVNASGRLMPGVLPVTITCALSTSLANDLEASETFGQPSSTTSAAASPPGAATLNRPWGKTYTSDTGVVYVADRGNNRVLGFYPTGTRVAKTAGFVLGQNNDFTGTSAGTTADTFDAPCSVQGEGDNLVITDCANNRVLIYNKMPIGHVAADVVVGQPDFTSSGTGCSPNTLSGPTSAVMINGQLAVADAANARVLIFLTLPAANAAAADIVLGQGGMHACAANQGGAVSASTLSSPQDVWSNGKLFFVTDKGNRRVLGWKYVPIFNGETADIVMGQPDMVTVTSPATGAGTLGAPMYVASDGQTMFVSDATSNRVVAYRPVPNAAGKTGSYTLGQPTLTGALCNRGQGGPSLDSLCNPTGLSYIGGSLVIADSDNNRLQLYNSNPNAAALAIGYFVVSVSPAAGPANSNTVTAGRAAKVTITAMNVDGTANPKYTGSLVLTTSDPNANLPGNANIVSFNLGVGTVNADFFTAGNQNVFVVDTNRPMQSGEGNFLVVPSDANRLVVSGYPNPAYDGQPNDFNVTLYDAYDNVATNYVGTLVITSNDGSATLPAPITFNAADMGTVSAALTFGQAGTSRITATDANNSVLTGNQNNILVLSSNGNAVTFTFSGYTSPVAAGQQGNVTVTARDANGAVAFSYLGTVTFGSTDANAMLPATTVFDQNAQGVAHLMWTFGTSGNQYVTATDAGGLTGTSGPVVVQGGNAVALQAFNYPNPATAGQSANITLRALDAYGNIAKNYAGLLNISVSDTAAVASPNYRFVAADNGNAAFPVTFETVGVWTINAQDVNVALLAAQQNQIVVQAGPVVYFIVGGIPHSVVAGTNQNMTISPRDAYDNLASSYYGSVVVTSTDAAAVPPNAVAFSAGIQTAPAGITFRTAGTWSVSANDLMTPSIAGMENTIVVTPGPVASLSVSGFPNPVVAGQQGNVTLRAYDAYGNNIPKYVGTVHITSSDAQAILPPDHQFTIADAGVATVQVTLETAGLQTINANDTNNLSAAGNQNQILVNPNVATSYKLSGFPAVVNAGQAANVTVTALDAYGNVATGYTGTTHFATTDPNAVRPPDTAFASGDHGVKVFSVTLKTLGAQTINANDGSIAGAQNTRVVGGTSAAYYIVKNFPATVTAGQSANVSIWAYDAYGNLATGYTGTVHLSSTDPNAVLQSDLTFNAGNAGMANMTVSLLRSGIRVINANDTGTPAIAGSEPNILVNPGPAATLGVAGFPNPVTAGSANTVIVTAYDLYGNVATGYTGQVGIGSSDANAVRPGNYTFTGGDAGVHPFTVNLLTAGMRNISATDTATASITGLQSGIVVQAGTTVAYTVGGFPTPTTAGAQGNVTVAARDIYNNIVTGYTGTVVISSTDPNAKLPANLPYVAANAGVAQLPVTLGSVGTWSINANDQATPAINGRQAGVVVGAGVATRYKVTGFPGTVTAGQQGNIHIAAYDDYNNLVTGYTGKAHVTSTDTNAVLPSDPTFVSGVADVPVTLLTSGIRAINANDTTTPSIAGNQNLIVVNPNVAQHLVANGFPSPTSAGAQGNIVVTAYDIYNNIAAGYTGTVRLSSADANALEPGDYTFSGTNGGVAQLPVTLFTSGNQNITVTDTGTASRTSMQNVVVNSNPATRYSVSGYPSTATAGQQGNVLFVARDNYNNVVTNYTGTLHISSTDVAAIVPYDISYSPANAGVMTLPVTLVTVGTQAIIGTDYDAPSITGMQNFIVISPNTATHIGLTGFPATTVAGTQGNITVTMLDAYGNTATAFTGTVNFTSDDTLAVFPASTAFVGGNLGVRTITATFNSNGNHVINANAAATPAISGQLPVVVVSPNSVTHFSVRNYPTSVIAGQQGNVTILAMDNYNNIVTNYTGTIGLHSTDPNAVYPITYTFSGSDHGNVTLPVTLFTSGTRAISANDTGTPAILGVEGGIVVNANAAVAFVLTGVPNPSQAGAGNVLTVTAFDRYNNVATTFADVVAITSSDANAALGAQAYLTNGVGTFGVTFFTAGTQWLNANDTTNAALATRQNAIVVNPAPASALVVSFPFVQIACQAANIIIRAVDNFNNTVPTYTGTVTVSSSDTFSALPAPAVFAAGNAGVRPLSVTLKSPGAQTLTATDGGGLTVTDSNITVTVGSPNVVVVAAPVSVPPTSTFGATVSIYDNCNNLTTGYTGTINLTSTDASGTPSSTPVAVTFAASDAGVKTVTGLKFKTVTASRQLNANDSVTPSQINGNTNVTVAASSFYADWDYTSANQSSYTYNSSKIDFQAGFAELTPINTQTADVTSANFAAGTAVNTRWDTGVSAMVQGNTNPNVPALVFLGGELFDPPYLLNTFASNTSGTYTAPNGTGAATMYAYGAYASETPFSGAMAYVMQGNQTANSGTSQLYMKVYDMTGMNFMMDANSELSYWFFPAGPGTQFVAAGNSNYAVVYVKFTDGTFTTSGSYTDQNAHALTPAGQGPNVNCDAWNRTVVKLGAQGAASKIVDHIGVYWNRTGAVGGFMDWFDDIMLTGVRAKAQTNNSTIASDWTPQYSSITAYFPFDGNGPIIDNANITSAIGPVIVGHNSDGMGLKYVAARFNQGVFFDGVDDYSVIQQNNFPGSTSMSVGGWVKPMALSNTGEPCPRVWIFGSSSSNFISLLPQCQGAYAYEATGVVNMRISNTDYFTSIVQSANETWAHWVSTYDGTTSKVYLNGQQVASTAFGQALSGALGNYNYFGADYFSHYFRGIVDEWAVWTSVLSPNDVKLIYDRQSALYTGELTSRVLTSPYQAAGTGSIAWNTTYPSGKPLPGNAVSERVDSYPQNGNTLETGLEYVWHFDEMSQNTVYGGDFLDDTGHGNTGFASGVYAPTYSTQTLGVPGRFNQGVYLNANYIATTNYINAPAAYTQSIWFRTVMPQGSLIVFGNSQVNYSANRDRIIYITGSGQIGGGNWDGGATNVATSAIAALHDGRWHHAAITSTPGFIRLYVDGKLQGTQTYCCLFNMTGWWRIGENGTGGWPGNTSGNYIGAVDEVAIWSRVLSDAEILQVYRRGAARFKFRVRTCANGTCSDNQAWRGPDGTNATYFTELLNTSGMTMNAWSPNLNIGTLTGLNINSNQGFLQYRGIWESDDAASQCTYNSVSAPCSAEDTNMTFNRVTYDTTSPTITNANTIAYYQLSSFVSDLGGIGCPGGVTYTLSPDNATYYYYTGSAWASSNGTVGQSSAATLVNANLASYSASYGYGQTYIKAFLTSGGTNPCTLQSVAISGTQ